MFHDILYHKFSEYFLGNFPEKYRYFSGKFMEDISQLTSLGVTFVRLLVTFPSDLILLLTLVRYQIFYITLQSGPLSHVCERVLENI